MSDTPATSKPVESKPETAKLPGTAAFDLDSARRGSAADADSERNEVFTSLVTGDTDIVGLVAYSIYKQNKHDWLVSFNKQRSREPSEDELQSYIIGESTPRRLAIYRHLADATLEGRGPTVNVGPASEKFVQRSLGNAHAAQASGARSPVGWIVAAVIAVVAVLLAGKYGIPGLR